MKESQESVLYMWYRTSQALDVLLSKYTTMPSWAKSRYSSLDELKETYKDRLSFEFTTIRDMGFCSYFLIVADGIEWSRNNNIPVGPGRGSAAGCLCTYLLKITQVDPIRYNLLFERFLNPDRISMPDIDVDYSQEHRHKVKEYFATKYGIDKVASIGTFSKMKVRAAIKDIVRSMNLAGNTADSFKLADQIGKTLENEDEDLTFADAQNNPEFKKYLDQYPVLTHRIQQYENIIRQMSMHAAGVLISASPFDEKLPMMVDKKGMTVTACDGPTVERLGYLKLDTLGLKNLDIIETCKKNIAKTRGKKVRDGMPPTIANEIDVTLSPEEIKAQVESMPDSPQKMVARTYQLLREGKTLGIFQCEMSVTADLLKRIYVNSIEEIAAVLALIRPGPRKAGSTEVYVARKKGDQPYETWYTYPIEELPEELSSIPSLDVLLNEFLAEGVDSIQELATLRGQKSPYNNTTYIDILDKALGQGDFLSKAPTVICWLSRLSNPEQDTFQMDYLASICDSTQGLPLFQEQLMQIAVKCAGFTRGESDTLRKGVGKKDKKVIDKVGKMFMEKMKHTSGVSYDEARYVWYKFILPYGSYGFNLSHSVAYGFVSYETAFLKANYPGEYYAALLSHEASQDKINHIIAEAKSVGIQFLPPRINMSTNKFEIINPSTIVYALTLMKGVGDKAVERIVEGRPYANMVDFIGRADCNAATTKTLIKGGAFENAFETENINRKNYFDFFEDCRTRLKRQTERLLKEALLKKYNFKQPKAATKDKIEGDHLTPSKWFEKILEDYPDFRKDWEQGQLEEISNFHYDWENPIKVSSKGVASAVDRESGDDRSSWDQDEIFDFEEEIFGTTISGHRLDPYKAVEQHFDQQLQRSGGNIHRVAEPLDRWSVDDEVYLFGLALQNPSGGITKNPYAKDKKKFTRRFYFEDRTGKMQLTLFEGTYEDIVSKYGDKLNCVSILEKKLPYRPVLIIKCKINDWNGRRSLIVQSVVDWANRDEILYKIELDKNKELNNERTNDRLSESS